jgi:SAM-dependent methyltransferase
MYNSNNKPVRVHISAEDENDTKINIEEKNDTNILNGWGSFLQKSKSLLNTTTTTVTKVSKTVANTTSNTIVKIGTNINKQYNEKVPENVKEKISTTTSRTYNAVSTTTASITNKSANIINQNVKPIVYNSTIGYFYSTDLIKHLLQDIPINSTIFDIGIGSCYAYCKNSDLIRERNIKIVGIDINKSYILKARHALIDNELDEFIKVTHSDNYDVELSYKFDYILFSDSYSVIPNINNTLRHYEKYLKNTGYMVVASTLFDEYNQTIDILKKNLHYGTMMIKSDLEEYIEHDRQSEDYEFNICKRYHLGSTQFNSYIVRWRPGDNIK